jgi:hypothetical protein
MKKTFNTELQTKIYFLKSKSSVYKGISDKKQLNYIKSNI